MLRWRGCSPLALPWRHPWVKLIKVSYGLSLKHLTKNFALSKLFSTCHCTNQYTIVYILVVIREIKILCTGHFSFSISPFFTDNGLEGMGVERIFGKNF